MMVLGKGAVPGSGKNGVARFSCARLASRRVERVFERLTAYPFFSHRDIEEFGYYRELFAKSLDTIDRRIGEGQIVPLDLEGFPHVARFDKYRLSVALFIGSFDPFQMTHLAMALRYLSSPAARARAVFVVPEGNRSEFKPNRSDYRYRFDILTRQLKGIFEPLVVPLDIGEGADTIEIVRRFMALFPGATIEMTHLIGSDVLPYAARFMPEDLAAWGEASRKFNVDFAYRAFVIRRQHGGAAVPYIRALRAMGVEVDVDRRMVWAPSSTDFREQGAFTIVFPSDSILKHFEVLFRYNLNKPWMEELSPRLHRG